MLCDGYPIRPDTLLNLLDFSYIIGLDPREVFSLSSVNCCTDSWKSSCSLSWVEVPGQRINTMSRINVLRRIEIAERLLADYLGYWPGPHYIEGETHFVHTLHDIIRTKYSKAILTGTRSYTQVAEAIPQTRIFSDPQDVCFDTCITYTIGDAQNPITNLTEDQLCRLTIMPPGIDPTTFRGHRIRPFDVVSLVNGILVVEIPVWVMVERDRYMKFPINQNRLVDSDVCDQDVFYDTIDLYIEEYNKPDGKLIIKNNECCCPTGGCNACETIELDICFVPEDPENGEFRFLPIKNTADPGDPECWELSDWQTCCVDLHYAIPGHSFSLSTICADPLYLKINYLSGCGSKCFGDTCFKDDVCPALKNAIAFLAAGLLDHVCDCGCTTASLTYYIQDMRLLNATATAFKTVYDAHSFIFGHTQGAVLAWDLIKNIRDKRLEYAII